ncbi:MAG: TetR/AcrR family transcriptional regulator [Lachnospiraceae bacterium]|nr:TetR/AcrR family transcriptional regulator [Lachnospiraceae bacterium]MDE6991377.1 TetR/AcrR family transcriptional regulator [Lachnospiraceae bacterium]MDE7000591.1 TetR/AcrR family transcriptional regulator [Lachnospiraceae bacterium]
MSKIDQNKQIKRESLLETAYRLFTSKGIHKTSISDIVEAAGVAKGTFYLYFKDKYDIRNKLIAHKSSEVFKRADLALKATGITEIEDRVVFLVDNIISQLVEDRTLLGFISKNLGWGVFKNVLIEAGDDNDVDFYDIYNSMFRDEGKFDNPEVMVFMIIELVGSTCHSTILHGEPVGIEEIKPYILRTVRGIMEMHRAGARQDLILNLQKSIK